uniref:Uncharacterized protein n=1 Tax=Anguilla anguilla TaxID=7936 RepID=A0A0E9QBW5_ANGAN
MTYGAVVSTVPGESSFAKKEQCELSVLPAFLKWLFSL